MENSTTLKFGVKDAIWGGILGLCCFAVVVGVCIAAYTALVIIVDHIVVHDAIDAIAHAIVGTVGIDPIDAGLIVVLPMVVGIPMLVGGSIFYAVGACISAKYGRTVYTAFAAVFFVGIVVLNISSHY